MTALLGTRPPLSDLRRRVAHDWLAWLERRASTGPLWLRVPFIAELAFERWAADLLRTWRSAMARRWGAVSALVPDEHGDQRVLAQSLLSACMVLAVLALAVTSPMTAARARFTAAPDPLSIGGRPAGAPPVKTGETPAGTARIPVAAPAVEPRSAVHIVNALSASAPVITAAATVRGALPVGKGMWIYVPERVEGGHPAAIVARSAAVGLTHLYVRMGSSVDGFTARPFLDKLLPAAHGAGLRVYGWDFPYLDNADGDVDRAITAITYQTPSGDRIDGFAADIELRSMGVNISPATAAVYGDHLRQRVGPAYPLIAVVPRPSPQLVDYPFEWVVHQFDAIAPMVYWLNREPVGDVIGALDSLRRFNKPIMPIGQAYDGSGEGGPPGVPGRDALLHFMQAADEHGAAGVSWWSWQHADQQAFDAIRDAPQFLLPSARPSKLTAGQVRAYQVLLTSVGYPVAVDGVWGPATAKAVIGYQNAAHLPVTAMIDDATRRALLTPVAAPVHPS